LADAFAFEFYTLTGVTVTWTITAPHTWYESTPAATTEKSTGSFFKRGNSNSIILKV